DVWTANVVPFVCREIHRLTATPELWHLLVLDGVSTHTISPKALQYFWDHKVFVVKMPAHSSADLQPLDKSVFHAVKAEYRDGLRTLIVEGENNGLLSPWQIPE